MRKLSILGVIAISIILILSLVLSSCSSGTSSSTTSSTTTSKPPTSTTATSQPPSSTTGTTTTSKPPTSTTTTSKPPTSTTTTSAGGTIKIGLASAYSGLFAAVAPYWLNGVQMAIDEANAAGGAMGRKFELVSLDDQGDPSIAVQKANELKAAGVVAIVGSLIESCDEAVFSWSKDNHMPFMVTRSPRITSRTVDFQKYAFFPQPLSSAWSAVAAQFVQQQGYKSVFFMGGDQTIAHELHDNFWIDINKLEPGVVADKGFALSQVGEMDYSNTISTILAKKPDLVISINGGPPFSAFMQQAPQFDLFSKVKFLGWGMIGGDNTAAFGKDFPTGLYGMDNCPFWLNTPEMQAFDKAYLASTAPDSIYPANITLSFYLSAQALCQAIKAANSTDPDAIVSALEQGTFNSPVGTYQFADYDHQAALPIWVSTTGYSTDFPIAIGLNSVKYLDGLYFTKDEVLALRAK